MTTPGASFGNSAHTGVAAAPGAVASPRRTMGGSDCAAVVCGVGPAAARQLLGDGGPFGGAGR